MAEKRPLCDKVTDELCGSSNAMDWNNGNGVPSPESVAVVYTILKVLRDAGDIPAASAHRIAERIQGLPEKLRKYNQFVIGELAAKVIEDLTGRVDPPKSNRGNRIQLDDSDIEDLAEDHRKLTS
ncbi:MAG: hypothetical protein Q7R67_02065 [bacterium]|nr:hypothetical protein [bacterium]